MRWIQGACKRFQAVTKRWESNPGPPDLCCSAFQLDHRVISFFQCSCARESNDFNISTTLTWVKLDKKEDNAFSWSDCRCVAFLILQIN